MKSLDKLLNRSYGPCRLQEGDARRCRVLDPQMGMQLSRERADAVRAEARNAGVRRRERRPRGVRRAVGVRLVSAGLRLIGGEEVT
jgi:hypothetical protein